MILLDTNVVSEAMRQTPAIQVKKWLDEQPLETLRLSAVTVAELRAGVSQMPAGRKRAALDNLIEKQIIPSFAGRVLAFDMACTRAYAELMANVRKAGRGIQMADAFIAAVALANGFIVATRDTNPFQAAGVAVINPWLFVGEGHEAMDR